MCVIPVVWTRVFVRVKFPFFRREVTMIILGAATNDTFNLDMWPQNKPFMASFSPCNVSSEAELSITSDAVPGRMQRKSNRIVF